MQVETSGTVMRFKYKVADGQSKDKKQDYGVYIAEVASMPSDLIARAKELTAKMREREENQRNETRFSDTRNCYALLQALKGLKHTTLSADSVMRCFEELKKKHGFFASTSQ